MLRWWIAVLKLFWTSSTRAQAQHSKLATHAISKICASTAKSASHLLVSHGQLSRMVRPGPVLQFGVYLGRTGGQINAAWNHSVPFIGFDSFEGLPSEARDDGPAPKDWRKGGYAVRRTTAEHVDGKRVVISAESKLPFAMKIIREKLGGDIRQQVGGAGDRIEFVRGFYSASLTQPLAASILAKHGAAGYVDIDCDLYISSVQAMDWMFRHGLAVPGTVFGYDDWLTKPCYQLRQKRFNVSEQGVFSIEQFGGEARAHVEIVKRYNVSFQCICGPCVAGAAIAKNNDRPYFVVRSVGERADTGYFEGKQLFDWLTRKCDGWPG